MDHTSCGDCGGWCADFVLGLGFVDLVPDGVASMAGGACSGCCPSREQREFVRRGRVFLGGVGADRQSSFAGEIEHFVGQGDLADFGMAVGLLAGAVFVDVSVGPVLAELRTAGGEVGYRVHYTKEPKPEDAPDNLFNPLPEHDTVEGTVGDHALRRSLYTWLELRPPLKRAASIAVTAAALTALRVGSR